MKLPTTKILSNSREARQRGWTALNTVIQAEIIQFLYRIIFRLSSPPKIEEILVICIFHILNHFFKRFKLSKF